MRILTHFPPLARENASVALAAGFFDGVHCGHRQVLDATLSHARRTGGQAWALTFDPHPMAVLAPERRPPLLTSTEFRLERLSDAGLDGCVLMPFTPALAARSAQQFVEEVLCVGAWHPHTVFAGDNWRFGAGGRGTVLTLPSLSQGRIAAVVVPPVFEDGEIVSSTRIRTAILKGHIQEATRLLGRHYRIRARVTHGRGIGRKLGAATANLQPDADVLPPFGIYALWVGIAGRTHRAVCDYGIRPTFADTASSDPVLEVHLLDFEGDLYGQEMDVAFVAFLREERRFASPAALVEQIRRDIADARRHLVNLPEGLFPLPHQLPAPES